MLLYCPLCQASFAGASRCPRCDGLLSLPTEPAGGHRSAARAGFDRPGPANRVVVGVILGLGLYLGLRKVASAAALAAAPEVPWWLTLDGLAAVYALQTAAAMFGGLVAAAGRHRGFPHGLAVGGLCGSLFLAAEAVGGVPVLQAVFLLQPPILAIAAGVAGVIGARVWAPVPDLEMRPLVTNKLSSVRLGLETAGNESRPTQFGRVMLAAVIMAIGFTFADDGRQFAQKHSLGMLQVETSGQAKFLSWQLAVVVVLVGGVVAGAGTGAGLWHGTWAGLFGGLGAVGLAVLRGGNLTPQAQFHLSRLAIDNSGALEAPGVAGIAGGVLVLGIVGGWLGSQLYLPLAPAHMRARRFKMND